MEMLAPRLLGELESIQTLVELALMRLSSLTQTRRADSMESYLYSQLENGRAFRLMTKLGFINERPEYVFLVAFVKKSQIVL